MPFPEAYFDKAYAIEATCHASSLEEVYGEIFRTLKPGGLFADYEWLTTAKYDPENPVHKEIMLGLEVGRRPSACFLHLVRLGGQFMPETGYYP